jgi:hypothetical protein
MAQQPSAAGQIWPHLAQGTRNEVEGRRQGSLAETMFPSLVPPKPKSPSSEVMEYPWSERMRELAGLRRIR